MVSLRVVAPLVALAALVTGVLFILDRSATVVVLSLVSVLLIAGSLYLLFGPGEPGAGTAHH